MEKSIPHCQTEPMAQSVNVSAIGRAQATELDNSAVNSEIVHIHGSDIEKVRRTSIVSIGEKRRSSIANAAQPNEARRGSQWSRRVSTGQAYAEDRKHSVYSIQPAQRSDTSLASSAESGITILDEERPPTPIQNILDAQAPGTYIVTVEEGKADSEKKDGTTAVTVSVSPLKYADKIASAGFLGQYITQYPMPDIQGALWLSRFRYGWFTVYRRLFALVFTANMIALIILASRGMRTSYKQAAIGVGSNILAAVLARHELLVNAVVSIVHVARLNWPIAIRKRLAKVYCHAGIHSACGASAAVWYIYFTILLGLQSTHHDRNLRTGNFMVTALLLICLLAMVGLSHPWFRGRYHNIWELSHRYLGWTITALIWVQVVLLSALAEAPLPKALVESSLLWMVVIVTCLLIYPWAMMRKRTFVANQLSTHALRLEFDYRRSRTGHCIRLAQSPLVENHGFQTISRADGSKGFSVIISNAGDWTKKIINSENRGNRIWVRGRLFLGVIEMPMLFSPLVVVATGSGIAPCLAFLQTHPDWPVRIVWSARSPEVTYGTEIMETILRADPDAIIIDTKETGRPNMPALMYAAYKVSQSRIARRDSTE
ncbi:Adenylate-forming reductase [Pseudocercospora fuligena]|uniref:Adenylate-forming reductase n=1 Tax=Pseudocercospora fuligena TaxID=685502 RepID=A0A8H6VE56_9PEZI|nr:Adenylate-forming reductase [Pseudocercospora fuligena]